MTGPEHYKEAERLIEDSRDLIEQVGDEDERVAHANAAALQACATIALVHATLALAAASAQNIRRNGVLEGGAEDWVAVLIPAVSDVD